MQRKLGDFRAREIRTTPPTVCDRMEVHLVINGPMLCITIGATRKYTPSLYYRIEIARKARLLRLRQSVGGAMVFSQAQRAA